MSTSTFIADTETLSYWVALSTTLLNAQTLQRALTQLGGPKAVWLASERALSQALKPKQVEKIVESRKTINPETVLSLYDRAGIQAISLDDPAYPELLKTIHDPPIVLYVKGSLAALKEKTLAVVGTRTYTDYSERVIENFMAQIRPFQPCIVSGLAAGVDTLAHQAALTHGLKTVAVFGTGIDMIFPTKNETLAQAIVEDGGALISEFPIGTPGSVFTFPLRNRIIAGLSTGTLVVEGGVKSGALITARCALEENRQVFAVPGSIYNPMSQGPNHLIAQGAIPVWGGEQIAQALNWPSLQKMNAEKQLTMMDFSQELQGLSPQQHQLLHSIGYEATPIELIQSKNPELAVHALNTELTMLELAGLIRALPGSKFSRN